tara:strand:+ start:148 stop:1197 length:1050 start_codon:yes stop_codon:yes gene_type:complete
MSMSKNIIDELKNQGSIPNVFQKDLIKSFDNIQLNTHIFAPIVNLFQKRTKGIYIWGEVGRGKTLLINAFLKNLPKKINFKNFHYIEFMNFIHENLTNFSGNKDPLKEIAKLLSKNNKLICIDEFQVEDVADAMIIGNLLNMLLYLNVTILITSNAHPDNLYIDGLQRQKFMKSINFLKTKIEIFHLKGDIDYRTKKIVNMDHKYIEFFKDDDIHKLISKSFGINTVNNKLVINDRKFNCKNASNNFLWVEFVSFFSDSTSSSDYEHICEKFDWIFISDFILCDDDSIDLVRRFISFIDIAYMKKSKVKFFSSNIELSSLYFGKKIDNLWVRCSSRLKEMQNRDYFHQY